MFAREPWNELIGRNLSAVEGIFFDACACADDSILRVAEVRLKLDTGVRYVSWQQDHMCFDITIAGSSFVQNDRGLVCHEVYRDARRSRSPGRILQLDLLGDAAIPSCVLAVVRAEEVTFGIACADSRWNSGKGSEEIVMFGLDDLLLIPRGLVDVEVAKHSLDLLAVLRHGRTDG